MRGSSVGEVEGADTARSSARLRLGALLRRRWLLLVVLAGLLLASTAPLVLRFLRDQPQTYERIEEHFKYGSIGSEPGGSLLNAVGGMLPPRAVFEVLPAICPDRLPGGYPSLGLIQEPGAPLPVGVSVRHRLGFEQVGFNCALCHTGSYRQSADAERQVVLGMPANRLELQKLFHFVTECVLDERFTADNVIGQLAARGTPLGALDRALFRLQVVPRVRETTLQLQGRVGMLLDGSLLAWGPGRVDTFNPYKAIQFNWRLRDLPRDELVSAANYPSLWNQRPRQGLQLHWDGNNDSVDERNLSAALGAGVTPVTVDHASIARIRAWIWNLAPPTYPLPIDEVVAERGRTLYAQHCLDCHGDEHFREGEARGARLGKVTPLHEVGTDPRRLDAYTDAFSFNQASLYPASGYRFTHFRKTGGYANRPLDGIWLRAPYLHNGSVPTLRDLLEPPEQRPRRFYRGDDVLDPVKVGFRSDRAQEGRVAYFLFDTALPGNGNDGHRYGTRLTDGEKTALVEYMKKL